MNEWYDSLESVRAEFGGMNVEVQATMEGSGRTMIISFNTTRWCKTTKAEAMCAHYLLNRVQKGH